MVAKALESYDWVIYVDSGTNLLRDPKTLLHKYPEKDIIIFNVLEHDHASRTKQNVMEHFGNAHARTIMAEAGFFLLRNTPFTRSIIQQWLELAQNPDLLTDEPKAYPGEDHRQDQSLLSLILHTHPQEKIHYGNEFDKRWNYATHHRRRDANTPLPVVAISNDRRVKVFAASLVVLLLVLFVLQFSMST
jgi:hypothetical protein